MGKSLGEYTIEKSSSVDMKNIKWSQKNTKDSKPKKKKGKKISPTNIIYTKEKPTEQKIFKVEDTEKPKKKTTGKRHQKSSASNCEIKPGFRRPGR